MYSFLSPENINYLIFKLRQIYPEDKYERIREETQALAQEWWQKQATYSEDQYVGGTRSLNEEFLNYVDLTRLFIDEKRPFNDMYWGNLVDPNLVNQNFQQIYSDLWPRENYQDSYNPNSTCPGSGWTYGKPGKFAPEIDAIMVGDDMALRGEIHDNILGQTQRVLTQRRDQIKPYKYPFMAGIDYVVDNQDSRSSEYAVRPRSKFTLPRDYETYESDMRVPYQQVKSRTRAGAYESAILPGTGIRFDKNGNMMPKIPIRMPRDNTAEYLLTQSTRYPNNAFYHQDYIPPRYGMLSSVYETPTRVPRSGTNVS